MKVSRMRHAMLGAGRRLWTVLHFMSLMLVLAVSPSSYRGGQWPRLARQLYRMVAPVLLWFTLLSSLIGLVLIRIVVVTARSYGLSDLAAEMVVRVLVLELIPLSAALFVAMRCSLPMAFELQRWWQQPGRTPAHPSVSDLQVECVPRAVSAMLAVLWLAVLSCLVALALTYLSLYGLSPWALGSYTRQVGAVFGPAVSLILVLKTFFFALTVALVPLLPPRQHEPVPGTADAAGLRMLVHLFLALLLIEALSLMGNYY